ncbi:thioesterase family protein [Blastochloris viridis]|uniref:3-hydroxyacyl-CoA dehydrogenase n=1 Tax=Blastochloris viridis TaxID=1079 RepID=A0A0H5BGQ8_BLAVI|nr:thioesterase family protein [Blastochloris viridis]ALK10493.1 L-carnitine dehydrogenase [Blastochloris viridis]BAR99561.1 3-hydroxyacyl-CoA dehydrogenase [Blastochloris viridis]CUU43155.1 bifunctional 3-hydroxyacyl-CoA dehydrogenase/thioesterase [Blastochloris viridis]
MLDRLDFEPVFFAPFVSSVMTVEPQWIDYNGHLNMAYYNVLFDRAVDEVALLLGLGPYYARHRGASYVSAEVHVRYLRELKVHDPVRVTVQLLGYDLKRLHLFQELYHAADGWISATSEQIALHFDLERKKAAPFPEDILTRVSQMKRAHGRLKPPEGAGRAIAMSPAA